MTFDGNNILLSPDKNENFVVIDDFDFQLIPINPKYRTSKGGNSNVFILRDPNGDEPDKVIKFCKSPISQGRNRRIKRFEREIRAFNLAKNIPNVIKFYADGVMEIDGERFIYIILEKAEDLPTHLSKNILSTSQKLFLCSTILQGLKELHALGIYHRDIKHDNILHVNGEWKITDLGLVAFRDEDRDFDFKDEKIGPFGWSSPEVMNKALTGGKETEFDFDCNLDEKSDIFQLGKLFWYVFQGNLPIGYVLKDDFKINDEDLFSVINLMTQYEKERRPDLDRIDELLSPLEKKYVI